VFEPGTRNELGAKSRVTKRSRSSGVTAIGGVIGLNSETPGAY